MKSLTESIINELRIAQVHTGNKLEQGKTFGELTKGDYVFVCEYSYSAKALTLDIGRVEKVAPLRGVHNPTYIVDEDKNKTKKCDANVYCIDVDNAQDWQMACISDAHSMSLGIGTEYFHNFASINALLNFMSTYNVDLT